MTIKIFGIGLSPYVRKVRMVLANHNLEYEHIPVIPGSEGRPQAFIENSPLGKVPLAHIDDIWLPDSSVILAYLDRSRPELSLMNCDPKLAARELWFEEYADAHMVSVISGHLFAEMVLAPAFFKRESNQDEIELAKTTEIPEIFDYLESQFQGDYLVGDVLGHADICVGSSLLTLQHCDYQCDASRWPKTAAYIDRLMTVAAFANLIEEEKGFIKSVT